MNPQKEQQPKMETVEEAAEAQANVFQTTSIQTASRLSFIRGVNYQKEHSYSEQEQWVSVASGNVPEHKVKVWAFLLDGKMREAIYYRNAKVWREDENGYFDLIVTHWRKLPAPPKQ